MNYALLDWDNTLRKGYTLFTWMDYLVSNGIVDDTVRTKTDYYIEKFKKQKISHDQLAKNTCDVFAKSIKGIKKSVFECQIRAYMSEDRTKIFKFTKEIFDVLNENKILPIIVSGAPSEILQRYQKEFNIYLIYGFVAEVKDDRFSGKVSSNYGYNKGQKVEDIYKKMGCLPKIAFGDSASDFDMLNTAEKSIIVCGNENYSKFKADRKIEKDMSPLEVRRLLTEVLCE